MTLRNALLRAGAIPRLDGDTLSVQPINALLDAEVIPGDRPVVVTREAIERVAAELCRYGLFPCDWDEADDDTKDGWRESAVGLIRVLFPGGVYRAKAVGTLELGPDVLYLKKDAGIHDMKTGDLVAVLEEGK